MNGNQRLARNPLTGQFAPAVYIGAFVPGSGDPYNGIVVGTDESVSPRVYQSAGGAGGASLRIRV